MSRPTQRKRYDSQDIVDHVYKHFFIENHTKCMTLGQCVYNQTGCAVGCLLTDEDANTLEKQSIGTVDTAWDRNYQMFHEYFSVGDYPLLYDLQSAHDGSHDQEEMWKNMREVFDKYGFIPDRG